MNYLQVFKNIEDEELRGDKYEALYEQREINNIKISLGANKIGVAKKVFFKLWHDNSQGNIFSLYALKTTENLNDIKIDNKCQNLVIPVFSS